MPAEKPDAEMKDKEEKKDGEKADEKKEEKKEEKPKDPRTLLVEKIATDLRIISASVASGDVRPTQRVVRSFGALRRAMTSEVLRALVDETVAEPLKALFLGKIPNDVVMGEDGEKWELKLPTLTKPDPPEACAFVSLLVLMWLSDRKQPDQVMECVTALVEWIKTFNRRTMDLFLAKVYFYFSHAHELKGRLSDVRTENLAAYRTACLRRDVMTQATLLNLLLRDYLACNLYEQALKLVSKTTFPESRPNAQYARYLYYIGQIKAVQLEYSDAHSKLMQAIRKAPQGSQVALGFKTAAYKLAIIVELLMGGIPDRATFTQKEFREPLRPYYAITQAVRSGDLNAFKEAMTAHEALFKKDKTLTLIHRLRYNVIKTGLRSINLSYSRISLADICSKLGLESPEDAAGIVSKAVVDGVIDATINYEEKYIQSKQKGDLYSSCEPQKAFHKRIAFCLQLHNDTIKSMAYPDIDNKDEESAEERRKREKEQLANVDDADGDDDMELV